MALSTFGQTVEKLEQFEQTQQAAPVVEETTAHITPTTEIVDNTVAVTDTPIADTPVTDTVVVTPEDNVSSFDLSIDGEPEVTAPVTTTTTAAPQFNFDEELKKIDRKEVLKKLGVNEFALEIDEYLSKGGNAIDYLNAKSIDYNKIPDEALLKNELSKQYPQFTASQIDLMFNRKYGISETAEDEDKEFAQLTLQADAYNIRQQKIAEQQKFKIPETPILPKDEAYEQWKQQQESQPKLMEDFRNYYVNHDATKALNESKRVTINLGEGVAPFNFTIEQPELITRSLTDGGTILNKLTTAKTGEPDVAKQQLISLFSFNPQKFIQEIFNYGRQRGVRQELVEEGQNAQRPKAIIADMNTNTKPVVTGVGRFSDKSR